jgi:hypothetical protein
LAEPFVKRALDHATGEILPEDLRSSCERRDAQLWLVSNKERAVGAAVTEIVYYPQRKHCVVLTIGGSGFPEWMEQLDQLLCAWAASQGCEVMEAHVRRGLVPRLAPIGYRHLHSIVYKPLPMPQNAAQELQTVEA